MNIRVELTVGLGDAPMSKLIKLIQMPLCDRKHRYLNLQAQLTPVVCQKLEELYKMFTCQGYKSIRFVEHLQAQARMYGMNLFNSLKILLD